MMTREEGAEKLRNHYRTEGQKAFQDGLQIADCPYTIAAPPDAKWGVQEAVEWLKGWHTQQRVAADGFIEDRRCGTCRLWAQNFFANSNLPKSCWGTGCCADTVVDLPSSWSAHAPMSAGDGADCPMWQAAE